jgi:hypothetical protein
LKPVLERYCNRLENLATQINFDALCNTRSPAFILERYMSFLLATSNVVLNECYILTPDKLAAQSSNWKAS